MKKNIGITDRIIRFVLFDLLLGFSLTGIEMPAFLSTFVFLVSILVLLTVLFARSPLYYILGYSSLDK